MERKNITQRQTKRVSTQQVETVKKAMEKIWREYPYTLNKLKDE